MISKRAALDLARQNLEDATVRAPIGGTIVSRPVTQGQIITAATAANGGTTLMSIADLGRVRMRVTIDEVEMGNIRVNLPATVAVDAFAGRTFDGVLEKIEPQAVVTQGVTFFPVEVSISNKDGLLMPGMNGEVTVKAADLKNVLQVPIDAIRATNELAPVARMFGLSVDTLTNLLRRDLVSTEGKTGIPGRYVVVELPDKSYEMRLIKPGPTDLKVAQVLDGLKEGDKVVMLGAVLAAKPPVPPKLIVAENMKRGAAVSRATQAGEAAPPANQRKPADKPAQSGKATKP
jgi:multidrug efflux pump subunit AcrA (membrane-fusion protein)